MNHVAEALRSSIVISRFASIFSVPVFFCRGRGRRVFPFPPLRCRIIPLFLAASLLRLPFIFVPRSIQTCGDFCLHTTLQERGPTPRGPTPRGPTFWLAMMFRAVLQTVT